MRMLPHLSRQPSLPTGACQQLLLHTLVHLSTLQAMLPGTTGIATIPTLVTITPTLMLVSSSISGIPAISSMQGRRIPISTMQGRPIPISPPASCGRHRWPWVSGSSCRQQQSPHPPYFLLWPPTLPLLQVFPAGSLAYEPAATGSP